MISHRWCIAAQALLADGGCLGHLKTRIESADSRTLLKWTSHVNRYLYSHVFILEAGARVWVVKNALSLPCILGILVCLCAHTSRRPWWDYCVEGEFMLEARMGWRPTALDCLWAKVF